MASFAKGEFRRCDVRSHVYKKHSETCVRCACVWHFFGRVMCDCSFAQLLSFVNFCKFLSHARALKKINWRISNKRVQIYYRFDKLLQIHFLHITKVGIVVAICDRHKMKVRTHVCVPCGLSMMDYRETSGNLRKPAAEVSGRFQFFLNRKIRKPTGNLPETSAAGLQRFAEVCRGFRIIHDWRTTQYVLPRMPSNLAAKKLKPGSWVASANVWSATQIPATYKRDESGYNKVKLYRGQIFFTIFSSDNFDYTAINLFESRTRKV